MNLASALTFEDASLVDLHAKPTEQEPNGWLLFETGLTPALAAEFGIKDLIYLENGAPRGTWTRIELGEISIIDVRVHTPVKHDGAELALAPKSLGSFAVKKTKGGALKLLFKARADGYLPQMSDFLQAVGSGPFRLEIEPLQPTLDLQPGDDGADADDKPPFDEA